MTRGSSQTDTQADSSREDSLENAIPKDLEFLANHHRATSGTEKYGSINSLAPTLVGQAPAVNDPFGDESGEGVKYKTLSWWQCGILLIAETMSLGVLSLPEVIATMGFVPGIVLIAGIGLVATYTGFVIAQFKQAFPQVHSFADAGQIMFGRVGKEIIEIIQAMIFIFIMAAHVLTFTVMMNTLTGHATCTMIFGVVGAVLSFILSLPRTMKNMSYISIFSCISVAAAVLVTMIGVGIAKPGLGTTFAVVPSRLTSISRATVAVADIIIAYTGHMAFFGFITELKQPRDFPKALVLLQTVAVTVYIVVAVVIYQYAGAAVASPALSSASPLFKKIAFAIAAPTIVVAGVINAHVCVKNIYVRIWRGTDVMSQRSGIKGPGSWIALCAAVWIVALLIAAAIPVFSQLLGLVGALFCSWFSLGIPACLWLYMNRGAYGKNWKAIALTALNGSILLMSFAVCIVGTY